jgi:hypothetical protein
MEPGAIRTPSRFAPASFHGVPGHVKKNATDRDKFAIANWTSGVAVLLAELARGQALAGKSWPLPSGQDAP